jgi:hypothetical protein
MSLCELALCFSLFSTVENGCGIVEAADFPIFHTPYKGVEKWKESRRDKERRRLEMLP